MGKSTSSAQLTSYTICVTTDTLFCSGRSSDMMQVCASSSTHSRVGDISSRNSTLATELHVSSYRRFSKLLAKSSSCHHHTSGCQRSQLSNRRRNFHVSNSKRQHMSNHVPPHPAVDGSRASSEVVNENRRSSRMLGTRISPIISLRQK